MATITQRIDDLDGSADARPVPFTIDGVAYTVDLAEDNALALYAALEPFITAARRTSAPARTTGRRSRAGQQERTEIREWANANGHSIGERGRIPANVVDAYNAAH
jgi:hypothetical protein